MLDNHTLIMNNEVSLACKHAAALLLVSALLFLAAACDANTGRATSGIPDGLNIDPKAACKLDVEIAHGQTCQLACLEGYVPDEKSGSQVLAQCDAGTLKYISGSCKAAGKCRLGKSSG
jgi:hypothetical protein